MKKQNIFNLIIFGILFFVSLASCQEEDHGRQLADNIVLRIQTQQSLSRATEPDTDAEDKIDRLDAWFYEQNADDSAAPLLHHTVEGNTEIKIDALTLNAKGMSATGIYDVYVVANLPKTGITVTATSTPGDLKSCEYIATSRPGVGDASFCMSKWEQLDFSSGRIQSILLRRQAVKLDINLVNETSSTNFIINKVVIRNDQQKVALFEPTAGSTAPASDVFVSDFIVSDVASTDDPAAYRAYIYENLSDIPTVIEVNATIDGETREYLADIKPNSAAKLPRNSACIVTLRLKDAEVTDIKYTIDSWTDKNMTPINGGTYLTLEKETILVSSTLNGLLYVKTNASAIQVDMSEAPGFNLADYSAGDAIEITPVGGIAYLTFREDAFLDTPSISGTVTITAGNITKKVSLLHIESAAKFKIKSITVNGYSITEGAVLPPTFGLPDGTMDAPITFVTDNNIIWQYKLTQFVGTDINNRDNLLQESDWMQFNYDGVPGEHTYINEAVPLIANDPYFNDVITCWLEIGIYGRNTGYKITEYKFTISKL